ncbi:hypothetical protein BDR04DRAFT_1091060 [Suillus decipiens]|nr:hypothetical protein BDR04DRAFT_1091060 [Suillus decipiens]
MWTSQSPSSALSNDCYPNLGNVFMMRGISMEMRIKSKPSLTTFYREVEFLHS